MTAAKNEFHQFVRETFGPLMASRGFRRKGGSFERRGRGVITVATFMRYHDRLRPLFNVRLQVTLEAFMTHALARLERLADPRQLAAVAAVKRGQTGVRPGSDRHPEWLPATAARCFNHAVWQLLPSVRSGSLRKLCVLQTPT